MYSVELIGDKIKAECDWGDDFPIMFAVTVDGAPVDFTGQEIVLGIKEKSTVLLESIGITSSNEVTFYLTFENMESAGMQPNKTYTFDFWNATTRYTYIEEAIFKTDAVSHNVEE